MRSCSRRCLWRTRTGSSTLQRFTHLMGRSLAGPIQLNRACPRGHVRQADEPGGEERSGLARRFFIALVSRATCAAIAAAHGA